jgi:hypothetical protein
MRTSASASGPRRRGVTRILRLVGLAALMVPAVVVSTANPTAGGGGGTFTATLTGAQMVPPNGSTATASAVVTLHPDETTYTVHVDFSGLAGVTINARIHNGVPGINGPVVRLLTDFPGGVTSGSYDSPVFLIMGGTLQVSDLKAGLLYVVISTDAFPPGELRGQLTEVVSAPTNDPPTAAPTTATPTPAAAPVPASARLTG